MRIFVYGTLLDPDLLARRAGVPGLGARMVPATLAGWRRVRLGSTPWPTLRRDPEHVVSGAMVLVRPDALRCLAAYEGPRYHLVPVAVGTPTRKLLAHAWIAPGATRQPWGAER